MLDRPGPLVEVEWIDSGSEQGWVPREKAVDPDTRALASGYLLQDNDYGVTIAQGADAHGNVLNSLTIPRVAVQAVHRLRRT